MHNRIRLICLLTLTALQGFSQKNLFTLTPLPLDNLSAFRNPSAGWTVSGSIKASYADTVLKANTGTGVLVGQFQQNFQPKESTNLFTQMEHGDLYLEMDMMMAKGSNSGIFLQGRYELQVRDSWGIANPTSLDMGGINGRWDATKPNGSKGFEGNGPFRNASLAPGLWQHIEIHFQSPRFDPDGKKTQDARFIKVVVNGITVQENIVVDGPTSEAPFQDEKASGPIMIQGGHGSVAFRNIRYAPLEDLRVAVTDLTYAYYEGSFEEMVKFTNKELVRKGTAENIDGRLADAKDNFLISFAGQLEVPATDNYQFLLQLSGIGALEIDGRAVIPEKWTWVGGELLQGNINLTQGKHAFQLKCLKHVNWAPAGLGIFIRKPNSKTVAIHSLSSLPERPPTPLIVQEAGKTPTLLRSFMMHKGQKLTHCISVGDPSGVHYAYNLRQAAPISAWKGEFLNTTDMWYERGEPQTAERMGTGPVLPGLALIAIDKNQLSDTVSYAELIYRGYTLNEKRYPTFSYRYQGTAISDQLEPTMDGRGLMRTATIKTGSLPAGTLFRIASGNEITALGNGLFAIDGQSYFLKWHSPGVSPQVQTQNGKAHLVADANALSSIQYTLIW